MSTDTTDRADAIIEALARLDDAQHALREAFVPIALTALELHALEHRYHPRARRRPSAVDHRGVRGRG